MAAAEPRRTESQLGAAHLQLPVSDVRADAGHIVSLRVPRTRVSYGTLRQPAERIERKVDRQPALDAVSAFTIVGRSAPRRDALDKVTGRAKFAGDVVPPGALHARILRPPAHGAMLVSADTSAAEARPGVRVIRRATSWPCCTSTATRPTPPSAS